MYKSNIYEELENNLLLYGANVNSDRAIPDATSGLKPVARRILWIMSDEGASSSKPHRKCAKSVGSVMGRVHPHGDTSIYEAMTRLAQPWIMRYPLIDWHGNMGSQSGDGQAAYRYTESRLSKISEQGLLDGVKKRVVDFQPNFSEDEEEPTTLPALFPNLLCNPNSGIGFAMACQWQPHNLIEVKDAIVAYMGGSTPTLPGPDFPTGGTIINGMDIPKIYETGKGSVKVRGNYKLEKRGTKDLIVFYEIPYGINIEPLLEKISSACKLEKIQGVSEIRDESNKKGLRLVIEVDKKADIERVINSLFQETDLQKSISFNQVALVDKTPKQLNLEDCIKIYISHQLSIITRECLFDLKKAQDKLHILEGLLIALEDIDNVIKLIKSSSSSADAKTNLISKYNLSEVQAKAILDMRLAKLAKLEKIEIENEKKELVTSIDAINNLLSSKDAQKKLLKEKLEEFTKTFGDERRTKIDNIKIDKKEKEEIKIIPEDVVVTIAKNGFIKRTPASSYVSQKRNGKGSKVKNDATINTIKTNTVDTLLLFSSAGKMYKVLVDKVPVKGVLASSLVKLNSLETVKTICSIYKNTKAKYVVFVTANGYVKKTLLSEYESINKSSIAIKLKEGDSIAEVTLLGEEDLILVTHLGQCIRLKTDSINPTGRVTLGTIGIKLNENDYVVGAKPINHDTDFLVVINEIGQGKKVELKEFVPQNKGGKGVITSKTPVAAIELMGKGDQLIVVGGTNSICVDFDNISSASRIGLGSFLLQGTEIKSLSKI